MYRLKLLGGLELDAPKGSAVDRAAQPRQLALLALLAACDSPLTRDKLTGFLWPEEADRRARRRLSDALYVLHRELGDDSIHAVGDALELDGSVVGSDLADYEEALNAGDLEEAVSLYGGPFLDGFFLPGTVEFERWVDAQRGRLARSCVIALETLARAAEERGELREAVSWWRRLVALDPYSSQAARRLMEALVAIGDRPAALQAARAHEQLIRSELDAPPDPEFIECVERLRSAGDRAVRAITPSEGAITARRWRGPRAMIAGGLLLGLLAAAVVWIWSSRPSRAGAAAGRDDLRAIAVLPWTVRGEARDLEYLEEGLVELLSISLDELPGTRAVDPYAIVKFVERSCEDPADPDCGSAAARRFGASRFVVGTVVPLAGAAFQLWASIYDAGGTELRRTTVPVDGSDPMGAIDAMGRRIAGMLPGSGGSTPEPAPEPPALAARTTSSLPALQAYLEGVARFRDSDPDQAIGALREAVALDREFALAWARLAVIAEIRGGTAGWRLADSAGAQALERIVRLPDRQQRLLRAFGRLRLGKAEVAEREFRDLLAVYPNDLEAWYLLAEALHHYNVVRGRPPSGEEAFQRVLEIDPDFRPALWHLRLDALSKGRIAEFDSLTRRFLALAPDREGVVHSPTDTGDESVRALEIHYARLARADYRLLSLLRAEDDSTRERWFADLERARGDELAWIVGIHFENLSWPGRVEDAVRAARILTDPARSRSARARGFVGLGNIALREGRWRDAFAALDSLATFDPVQAALWRADWASSLFLPLPASRLSGIRSDLAAIIDGSPRSRAVGLPVGPVGWTTTPPWETMTWGLTQLSVLSARLGGYDEAREYAARLAAMDTLERDGVGTLSEDLQWALRAELLWEQGDLEAARAALESIRYEVRWDGLSAGVYPQLFLRAEVLYALGELEEARRWYALWTRLTGPRFLGPALRRLAQIHEALGEPQKALSRYEEFVSLWRNADPELQPWVQEARDRIAVLAGAVS